METKRPHVVHAPARRPGMEGRRRRAGRLAVVAVAAVVALLQGPRLPEAGRWVDRNVLAGRAKDAWNHIRWHEDWRTAEPLRGALDRGWLESTGPLPVRIAHALGASGRPDENRPAAVRPAWDDGFRRFEIDVWLDAEGRLRCHHGPPPPAAFAPADCTLEAVVGQVAALGGWVVLDIKTDFDAAGSRIAAFAKASGLGRRIVFQLYAPAHLASFNRWSSQTSLAEPIVTAYASHRRVQHIANELGRLRVAAFTVPIETLPSLTGLPAGMRLLVHPVHDCGAWKTASGRRSWAVYTVTGLHCPVETEADR